MNLVEQCWLWCINFFDFDFLVNIIGMVTNQIQSEEDTVTLTCQAAGEPIPNISWYFNDVPVNKSNKYQMSTKPLNYTSSNSILTVKIVKSSDVGTYTCYATNGMSSAMSSGILSVTGMCITKMNIYCSL